MNRLFAVVIALALCSCDAAAPPRSPATPTPLPVAPPAPTSTPLIAPSPTVVPSAPISPAKASPTPEATPSPLPPKDQPLVVLPAVPALTKAGYDLVLEFEVGGPSDYHQRPEAPDARYSGITEGIGYDNSTVDPALILADWAALGPKIAQRLAATHPFTGKQAQAHLKDVHDILVPWLPANDVFARVDVAREFARAKKAMPGFELLRPNAQAALISLGFNRGWSMTGSSRTEMREIRDLVPKQDYAGLAKQFRVMVRVWKGTEIERGMTRRRLAEAKLVETP